MSDTYRRYRAIKQGLMQFYQPHPSGHQECHLNTLVGLICGLTGSQRAHLSSIADHAPSHSADQESVIILCWLPFLSLPFSRGIGCRQHRGRIVARVNEEQITRTTTYRFFIVASIAAVCRKTGSFPKGRISNGGTVLNVLYLEITLPVSTLLMLGSYAL